MGSDDLPRKYTVAELFKRSLRATAWEVVSSQPMTREFAEYVDNPFPLDEIQSKKMTTTMHNMKLTFNVKDLIPILEANRAKHAAIFEEARAAYIKECEETFRTRADEIKSGEITDLEEMTEFDLPVPVEYLNTYDTVIQMLKLTTELSIELSSFQFNAWVRDQWDWKDSFARSIVNYTQAA